MGLWSIMSYLIFLLSGIIAAIVFIIGAIIAVRYKKRMISQYLYSLILILMFLMGYIFTDSPFNLMTRLSGGSIGAEALIYCGAYSVADSDRKTISQVQIMRMHQCLFMFHFHGSYHTLNNDTQP